MDFIVVAAKDNSNNILSDVMNITFHCCQYYHSSIATFLLLHELDQVVHSFFHHTCSLNDLGQEHLASTKALSDNVHTIHQRTFDDLQRLAVLTSCFLNILFDEFSFSLNQSIANSILYCVVPPLLGSLGILLSST